MPPGDDETENSCEATVRPEKSECSPLRTNDGPKLDDYSDTEQGPRMGFELVMLHKSGLV